MNVSRPVAWFLLLLTLFGSSLLRQLHDLVPDWTPLPWPVRSPIYALLVVFFLVLAAAPDRRRTVRQSLHGRVDLALLMPFVVAVIYEKVLSFTLYEALFDHAVGMEAVRNRMDSWIHIIIGVGMLTAVLLLVPLMRRVGFPSFLSGLQLRSGLYLQFFALILVYGAVAGLMALLGGGGARPALHFPVGQGVLFLVVGQGVRAMAEEFYYRGLLQVELQGLMGSLGVTGIRNGQALAIVLISLGFGLEHFLFGAPLGESYAGFAYAVAASFLFGYLLVLTRNVFFCGLVHATNNFMLTGVMPRIGSEDGGFMVPTEPMLYLYLIAVFLLVFLASATRLSQIRRIFLPGNEPAATA